MGSGISSEQFSSVKDKYEELKAGGTLSQARMLKDARPAWVGETRSGCAPQATLDILSSSAMFAHSVSDLMGIDHLISL
jgi:hypothetical protein